MINRREGYDKDPSLYSTMASDLQPPTGGDESRGPGLLVALVVLTTASLLAVCVRMYVRTRIVRAVGMDDWTVIAAMVFNTLNLAFDSVTYAYGYGRHEYYLSQQQQIEIIKYNTLGTVTVVLAPGLAKTSICLFLLRLLGTAVTTKRKAFLYGLILFLFVYSVLDIISIVVQCKPTSKIWNRKTDGTCWAPNIQENFAIMQGACSVFTAFSLSIFPIFILKDLQLGMRTKVALGLLLGLGIFDGICAIVRTSLLPGFLASDDYTYTSIPLVIWACVETNVCIIAACIPAIRPLFQYFNKTGSGAKAHRNRKGYSIQYELGQYPPIHSSGTGKKHNEYGVMNYISSQQDGSVPCDDGSERSTLPLRGPTAIRKTTEIDVSN